MARRHHLVDQADEGTIDAAELALAVGAAAGTLA